MGFAMLATLKEGVKSWRVTIVHAQNGVQTEFSGLAPVPPAIVWDGRDRTGFKTAEEGLYTAALRVEYFKGNLAESASAPFRLVVNPPRISVSLSPLPFSPDNDGSNDELEIGLKIESVVPLASWELRILDPAEHPFNRFAGKGAPSERILWDGTSEVGELVQSAEDYPLLITIRDELGLASTARSLIPIDILVLRDGEQLKVRIASITFAPDTAAKNAATIRRLAEVFKKYDRYRILIEGHANLVNWDDPLKAKREQEQELIPLSKLRADSIRDALVQQGIEARRITTTGVGAAQPILPFDDLDNRWKNRRVEFILTRE